MGVFGSSYASSGSLAKILVDAIGVYRRVYILLIIKDSALSIEKHPLKTPIIISVASENHWLVGERAEHLRTCKQNHEKH